jgi:hypothetical protein
MHPWLAKTWAEVQPPILDMTGVEWAEQHVRLPGSARSERYDSSITPWGREPLNRATSGECRIVTFIKPVQSGGSVCGEAAICFWLATESGGDIQYNWADDGKSRDRWDKREERILKACVPVMERAPSGDKQAGYWKKGQIIFPHCNFIMQGVFNPDNLDSDSIRFQINEEVHAWEPGHLQKAYNRTTAVWNSVIFNISNAGNKDSQLHQAFLSGTQQHWEVKCPGCGQYHVMQTRWDHRKPQLGGLRYDSEGCKLPDGGYNYNKIESTVRYQMPCGYEVRCEPRARKALSQNGRYGAPQNHGAILSHPSFTMEAVSVDYIPWLKLIQEKHDALRAMKYGDPKPYLRYVTERECRFWDDEDRPVMGAIVLNSTIKKNRDGMPNRKARFGALDRQRGSLAKGELPHWWGVIRDVDEQGNSLLVWEGKLLTDEEAADVMKRHEVRPQCVVVDSGDDTTHVYQFCLRHKFSAIKGSSEPSFSHPDGSRKIFSPERPLHLMLNAPRVSEDPLNEPLFWFYSKSGIRERLHWLRNGGAVKWEVPGDVSDDYKAHNESEELRERKLRSGETISEFIQVKPRNDLYVCEGYCAMLMEMAGFIGQRTGSKL